MNSYNFFELFLTIFERSIIFLRQLWWDQKLTCKLITNHNSQVWLVQISETRCHLAMKSHLVFWQLRMLYIVALWCVAASSSDDERQPVRTVIKN